MDEEEFSEESPEVPTDLLELYLELEELDMSPEEFGRAFNG